MEHWSSRRWIVKGEILDSGKLVEIPSTHASDFRIIKTNDPITLFRMFQNGAFKELYIFGLDLEEDSQDIIATSQMIKQMLKGCKDVYYCTDYDVPSNWPALNLLKVISVDEGISLVQK